MDKWGKEIFRTYKHDNITIDVAFGYVAMKELPPAADGDGNFQFGGFITEYRNENGELTKRVISPPAIRIIYDDQ